MREDLSRPVHPNQLAKTNVLVMKSIFRIIGLNYTDFKTRVYTEVLNSYF